jgi:hypothetical protein
VATLAARIADLATAIGTRIKAIETLNATQGRTGTTVFGYSAGAGGTIAQTGNKSTAVTLNKLTGEITMVNSALAAGAIVTFTLNNSTVVAGDQLVATHHSGGTAGPYLITPRVTGNGVCTITVRNTSAASLSEAIALKFTVIKAANA